MRSVDVLVAGGGVSGAVAAIAAARMGANTLLVEQNGYLGGAITACGVGPLATFHAGEKQVIGGITQELINQLQEAGGSLGHLADTSNFVSSLTPVSVEAMKRVLERMYLKAGGRLLYHTVVTGVQREGERIRSAHLFHIGGEELCEAKLFLDCTGDASLCYLAGVPCTKGRISDGLCQPMTLKMRYFGVNSERLRNYILNAPKGNFARMNKNIRLLLETPRITTAIGFVSEFSLAKAEGELHIPRENIILCENVVPGEYIVNTTRIIGLDPTNPEDLTQAEIEGREQAWELDRFLRLHIPGFEDAQLAFTGPSIGIRSSRQLVGAYTITKEDVTSQRRFSDTICLSGFPVDIHSPTGEGTHAEKSFHLGNYASIPYRALYTPQVANLLVAGRCLSATFEAQSALRTGATVGGIGHAAGVAAALALANGGDVRRVEEQMLRQTLVKQRAILA